jgi:O-antigen ligase
MYHSFSGTQMFTGIASHKNGLGGICLISGIYYSWVLLFRRWGDGYLGQRLNFLIYIIIIPMIIWLLDKANSATSLTCMVVALGLFIVSRQPAVARKPLSIMVICLGCIIIFEIMEFAFDFTNTVIIALGRRPDLTTRVPMWADLLSMVKNPVIGFGNESFWLGERLIIIQQRWGKLVQAHNGYLETYLNLGGIGLFLLVTMILTGLKKVSNSLSKDYPVAVLRLLFIVIVALYNFTEASFYGQSTLWTLFFIGILGMPEQQEPPLTVNEGKAE